MSHADVPRGVEGDNGVKNAVENLGGIFHIDIKTYLNLPGYTLKASSRHLMAAFRSSMQMQ